MVENKLKGNKMNKFKDVRNWGKMRGIEGAKPEVQLYRMLEEVSEVAKGLAENDEHEFKDAIGDTIVTLIMLAGTKGYNAEDCLDQAFNVIKYRKGLNKNGSFVRYAKLSDEEKEICDKKQGNPGEQYFLEDMLNTLKPKDFLI
jgi:NTP pyrophosphatase (non-canonical NTP hydrolase)